MSHVLDDDPLIDFKTEATAVDLPPWRATAAAAWTLAGAAIAAAVWSVVVFLHRSLPGILQWDAAPALPVLEVSVLLALYGWGCGFAVGGIAGLLRGRQVATGLTWAFGWAMHAAPAAGLGPVLASALYPWLPPIYGFGLAPVLASGMAGLVSYTWGHTRSRRAPRETGPVVRLAPVLIVSAACLVAVVAFPPSPAGWAMLAVGLLGLAVAWALAGQERRLRELERELRVRNAIVEPDE